MAYMIKPWEELTIQDDYMFKLIMSRKLQSLPDGATKVFLSTKGELDDVTPDVKAFLDYVDGVISNDDFVQEIDREIKDVKTIEQERRSYMTYEMKMREERKEGRKEMLNEMIISMLNRKKSPSFIAEALEISMDVVYSIAEKNGIAVQR